MDQCDPPLYLDRQPLVRRCASAESMGGGVGHVASSTARDTSARDQPMDVAHVDRGPLRRLRRHHFALVVPNLGRGREFAATARLPYPRRLLRAAARPVVTEISRHALASG